MRRTRIRDGVHVLHCQDGPALAWNCGTTHWYIDGVRVDEQIVMRPETQTIEQIENEPNEEVRRIRIERFAGRDERADDGWRRYLCRSGSTLVQRRTHPGNGYDEVLIRDPKGRMKLVVTDPSTHRMYVLGVPRGTKTCSGAQEFLSHGLDSTCVVRT